jgi:hypothetical protein
MIRSTPLWLAILTPAMSSFTKGATTSIILEVVLRPLTFAGLGNLSGVKNLLKKLYVYDTKRYKTLEKYLSYHGCTLGITKAFVQTLD